MRIVRRAAAPVAEPAVAPPQPPQADGAKGRPTPKRREAQARRRTPVVAPGNRREAAKLARSESRDRRREARAALARGDERHLPARDAGPVRRYARDVVDARRNVGGLFLPMALVIFAMSYTKIPALRVTGYLLWLALIVALFADSVYVARRIRHGVGTTYPGESTKGVGLYAAMRGMQIRRLRLPPPRVSRGTHV